MEIPPTGALSLGLSAVSSTGTTQLFSTNELSRLNAHYVHLKPESW